MYGTILDDGSSGGKNTFDQSSSHVQSIFASFDTFRSQFFNCGRIFGSESRCDRCGVNCWSNSLNASIGISDILGGITITIWLDSIVGGSKGELGKTKDGKSSNLKK